MNDYITYSHWRLFKVSGLVNIRSEISLDVHALHVFYENLAFFSRGAPLRELHEYFKYSPDGEPTNAMDAGHVAESMVTLAGWMHSWRQQPLWLRKDGRDKIGCHRKKLITTHHFFFWRIVSWSWVFKFLTKTGLLWALALRSITWRIYAFLWSVLHKRNYCASICTIFKETGCRRVLAVVQSVYFYWARCSPRLLQF